MTEKRDQQNTILAAAKDANYVDSRIPMIVSRAGFLIIILLYLVVVVLYLINYSSIIRIALAAVLNLFAPGYALTTVLFSKKDELDLIERMALAGSLSLAIIGFLGYVLARLPWGLKIIPLLISSSLFTLVCFLLFLYRIRAVKKARQPISIRLAFVRLLSVMGHNTSSRVFTIFLIIVFIMSMWVMNNSIINVDPDPAMTEFFILGDNGQISDYSKNIHVNTIIPINFGIGNFEKVLAQYDIFAVADDTVIGGVQGLRVEPGETYLGKIEIVLPEQEIGKYKVEFELYKDQEKYRTLSLWLEVLP